METDSYTGGRPFETSFEIGRALGHGFRALRRCLPILWVGGCIRACTSGGGGGGGGGGAEEHEREGARQVLDHAFGGLGLGSHLPVASIGGMEAAIVIVLAVVVLFVVAFAFAIQAWFVPGWLRVHEEIARTGEAQWGTL